MRTDWPTAAGSRWVSDTNAILATALLLALPAVVALDALSGGNLRVVFLTTLAVGTLPPYIYSKLPRQFSPGRAALWGLGVALGVLALLTGLWAGLRGPLGDDGASILAFLVVMGGSHALLRVWQPSADS